MKFEIDNSFWVNVEKKSFKDEVSEWFCLEGSEFRILIEDKFPYNKHFRVMIEDCIKILGEKDKKRILNKLRKEFANSEDNGE